MSSKRQRRVGEIRTKKKKRGRKVLLLVLIGATVLGFLIFFFISVFNSVYPPVGGKETVAKKRGKRSVTAYFSDANERFLVAEKRWVPKSDDAVGQAREIIRALVDGSKEGNVGTFPEGTTVQSVKLADGLMTVSFGGGFVKNHPGGSASELATIYSLVNSLTANLPSVKKVRILVEGRERESIKGHIDLRRAFTANSEMIAPTSSKASS